MISMPANRSWPVRRSLPDSPAITRSRQQALKAVLIFAGDGFLLRHDLDQLRSLIPAGWPLKQEHPNLGDLAEWAVETRYPGNRPHATAADARSAAA
jgi:hypothetical protein